MLSLPSRLARTVRSLAVRTVASKPWTEPMPAMDFDLMRDILSAPSPVGMEGAMTHGVIEPYFRSFKPEPWAIHKFKGQAGIVLDSSPESSEKLKVLIVGHADKIRMQVKSISSDGKLHIASDSMLPMTLIGNRVKIFTEDKQKRGHYRGGTVEAIGAIHFAEADLRTGARGVKQEQLYIDLGMHGKDAKAMLESAGILPGDPILFDRPIKPAFGENTFSGAYLDNGLGCFVMAKVASMIAKNPLKNLRVLFGAACFEEIGRFGSRVFSNLFQPDVILATDVNFDYVTAPEIGSKHPPPLALGKGFTISHGSITHPYLNSLIETTAKDHGIPYQIDVTGGDTGTDAMAGVLSSQDVAATSIGFPIRNMHTISELGNTQDVQAAIYALYYSLLDMDAMNNASGLSRNDLKTTHPRLDLSQPLYYQDIQMPAASKDEKA